MINQNYMQNPYTTFLFPSQVTTVDKYQGQQNDIALVSLVRTRAVGHVRDLRRLIVAASRARLGLYIFARANLFRNCFELQPTFNQVKYPDIAIPNFRNKMSHIPVVKAAY